MAEIENYSLDDTLEEHMELSAEFLGGKRLKATLTQGDIDWVAYGIDARIVRADGSVEHVAPSRIYKTGDNVFVKDKG